MDIFSSFDDHNFVLMDLCTLLWFSVLVAMVVLMSFYWVVFNKVCSLFSSVMGVVEGLVSQSGGKSVGGSGALFVSLFVTLVFSNIMGLVPYVFSLTSHLAINLGLSLPLWVSIVLMSFMYDSGSFMAHLQPMGSPTALNPFLCLIELSSLLVRPITLAVRLTANLSTGHILMGLLGLGFTGSGSLVMLLILMVGVFYFMFEMGVCVIQSYIFTLLPNLYVDEHPGSSH